MSAPSFFKRIAKFFLPDPREQATLIYGALHSQARDPWFYEIAKVPNTLDGRFEMLVLHVFLWITRMKQEEDYEQAYQPATTQLLEILFDDMDSSLREVGVGDTGVPRRIKQMAEALYGRLDAYEQALESKEKVHASLKRNVYGTSGQSDNIDQLQLYLGLIADHLSTQNAERLSEGSLNFPTAESLMS